MNILNRFDLNLLVVFEAVYTEGGVSRAADSLCLTQSAVSHALRRLRENLNDPLFTRHGAAMVPNGTAEELIGPIRLALATVKKSLEGMIDFDPQSSARHFRIGVRGFGESVTIPPVFAGMRKVSPHASLGAIHFKRSMLAALLKSRTIDIALDSYYPCDSSIRCERLGAMNFVVLLRANHPALETRFALPEYMKLEHVVASTRVSGLGAEEVLMRAALRDRRIAMRCQNYTTAAQIVATSDIALTVPSHFSRALIKQFGLREVNLFPNSYSQVAMYYDGALFEDPASVWLRSIIREAAHMNGLVKVEDAEVA